MNKNDNSLWFENWTTKELKQEAINYDELINIGCYGTSDVRILEGIMAELDKRGVESKRVLKF